MKSSDFAWLAVTALVASNATAQDRAQVQDARPLLIAAIEAPDGQSRGVLVGEIADAITQKFKGTSPIYIDVATERRYAQAGCSRLKVRFWQEGVQLPGVASPRRQGSMPFRVERDSLIWLPQRR